MLVPTFLNKGIENLAFIVDRAPQPHPTSTDLHHHLVKMPPPGRRRSTPAQLAGEGRSELDRPGSHRLVTDVDASLGEQVLDVTEAHCEPEIQLYRLADHVFRKPVALVRNGLHHLLLDPMAAVSGDKLALV